MGHEKPTKADIKAKFEEFFNTLTPRDADGRLLPPLLWEHYPVDNQLVKNIMEMENRFRKYPDYLDRADGAMRDAKDTRALLGGTTDIPVDEDDCSQTSMDNTPSETTVVTRSNRDLIKYRQMILPLMKLLNALSLASDPEYYAAATRHVEIAVQPEAPTPLVKLYEVFSQTGETRCTFDEEICGVFNGCRMM